jgi:outer membrane protein assembly factor BamA
MHVVYRLQEGEQVFVDRILMSGLDNTKSGIAERQFQFQSGDPLSQTAILDTQRRLYDLGVFNEVKLAVQNREGDAKYKNILLQFTEARRWTFNYGLGVEIQSSAFGARTDPNGKTGASPTVSFDVSRLNVGGRAHTLSFKSHLGRLQQRALATYEAPRLFNQQDLRLTLNLFYDNSLDVRTFTSQRMESSIQLEQVLSRISTLLYRFTYRRVQASELQIDPAAIPLLSRPVRVGLPSISYIRDKRDDPIETHNGNYSTLDAGVASSIFGSEADFGRLLVQNSTYHPFRSRQWVFARYTQIGIAKPFGSVSGDPSAEPVIPLPERFFAGGANGLRGFALNQAGPRDLLTGQVLGGEAVFVNSLELRTPPLELPYLADNLSFAFFHDAGNVFSSVGDMGRGLLQWVQKDRELCTSEATASQCNFAYLSHALGLGIRYRTPIGPVRLDVGYNLNPPTFPFYDDPEGRVGFHSSRTGRFQFSFSVGQTF